MSITIVFPVPESEKKRIMQVNNYKQLNSKNVRNRFMFVTMRVSYQHHRRCSNLLGALVW